MMKAATVINPTVWPTDSDEQMLFGDCEIAKLAKDAGIPVRNLLSFHCDLFKHAMKAKPHNYICLSYFTLLVYLYVCITMPDVGA